MINRFQTRCLVCGHFNTLRITLGVDAIQEHSFKCMGCGEPNKVRLNIDFEKRREIPQLKEFGISMPSVKFTCLENCDTCDEEGTITNLDPTFLMPEEMLHQDKIFPWMAEFPKFLNTIDPIAFSQKNSDIINAIGGQRNLRDTLDTLVKAYRLHNRGQSNLSNQQLEKIKGLMGMPEPPLLMQAIFLTAATFLGPSRQDEVMSLIQEIRRIKNSNEAEFQRFRSEYYRERFDDLIERQIEIISEYLSGYDQFIQTWLYASLAKQIDSPYIASSKDLQKIKMFYGNVFEELSAGLFLPACLNNISCGRDCDQFEQMSLTKYLVTNKANRANSFIGNHEFYLLHNEFDSTLRNSTHHRGFRLAGESKEIIEYRSGDSGQWKQMYYTEYLLKCNKIMFCMMRLLTIQVLVAYDMI